MSDPTSSPRSVNFENTKDVNVGGHVVGGDLTINHVTQGLNRLATDYSRPIKNFLQEYLGSATRRVPFGGRAAPLAALDAWLDDGDAPPYALLVAEAGRGKSALLARWLHARRKRDDHHLVFIPVSIRFNTALESVVFTALAARLGEVYGEPVEWANLPAAAWRGVCQSFLGRTPPGGKPLLVILDGLDEAADWQAGADLFPLDPPPGVRVVVAARRLAHCDEEGWRQRLNWASPTLARAIPLPLLDEGGLRDVLQQMGNPLDTLVTKVDVVRELHHLSEGDPLLVRLYVEALVEQKERVAFLTPDELAAIPPGLGGYLDRWWNEQRQQWGKDSPTREPGIRALLNLLAAALGPLEKESLLTLAPPEAGLNTWTLDDALAPLARFIVGDGVTQGYVFSHPRLGYHFWEKLTSHERTDWETRFLRWGKETLHALNAGTLEPKAAPRYIVQHYGAHLERAKAPDEALYALVSEGWMRAWEWLEGTYAGFLTDVERARKRAADEKAFLATQAGRGSRLAMQIKCALCQSSMVALVTKIRPAMLGSAIRNGVVTYSKGLSIIRQMNGNADQAKALEEVAPLLPKDAWTTVLEIVFVMNQRWLDKAIEKVAPHLPPEEMETALLMATKLEDEYLMSRSISALIPYMPEELISKVVQMSGTIKDQAGKALLLKHVISRVSEDTRQVIAHEAIKAAELVVDEEERWRLLLEMGEFLPNDQAKEVIASYQAAISQRLVALEQRDRYDHLSKDQMGEVFIAAERIGDSHQKYHLIGSLLNYLPTDTVVEVLTELRTMGDAELRTIGLSILVEHFPEDARRDVVIEVLLATEALRYEEDKIEVLLNVMTMLPLGNRVQAITTAVKSLLSLDDYWLKLTTIQRLAPYLAERARSNDVVMYQQYYLIFTSIALDERSFFLEYLAALMPFVLALAGDEAPQAAQGIFEAIQEVCGWWP